MNVTYTPVNDCVCFPTKNTKLYYRKLDDIDEKLHHDKCSSIQTNANSFS